MEVQNKAIFLLDNKINTLAWGCFYGFLFYLFGYIKFLLLLIGFINLFIFLFFAVFTIDDSDQATGHLPHQFFLLLIFYFFKKNFLIWFYKMSSLLLWARGGNDLLFWSNCALKCQRVHVILTAHSVNPIK